jgi:ornithine cyclodeaminase
MKVITLDEIKDHIDLSKIIAMQEDGFKLSSAKKVDIPPVGYLKQHKPSGSYHIKYGLIENDDLWVTKIAGGPDGLPLSGIMVAISTKTGKPEAILMDDGYLTQLRTAIAGLISAKYLAPKNIKAIGVIGTGIQARMQISMLKHWSDCRNVFVWGRDIEKVEKYKEDIAKEGFISKAVNTTAELSKYCNLIITTTASSHPLLQESDIQPGTHITAIGADSPGKIELDPKIIAKANIVVVDSRSQCIDHGEIYQAYKQQLVTYKDLTELGEIIVNPSLGRRNDTQITIADLTGVAVQDIQIVKSILQSFKASAHSDTRS